MTEDEKVEAVEEVAVKAPSSGVLRRVAKLGARGVLGLVGVGIAGFSIVAATIIPLPHVGVGPTSTLVSPVSATQQRICAGPVLQLGDATGQDATTAMSIGEVEVTRASTSGTPALESMEATENSANTPSQRLLLAPPPIGEAPGVLAGSQSQRVESPELTGLAVSECVKPGAESWLVGGSTVTGRTTLLSLNNPSKVNSTVKLTIYSETGLVDAVGTEGILVPPGGRRVLSLAGFAPGLASPVVHVESAGGQVSATLQQSIVRTLTPGGVDLVSTSTGPTAVTVIPGIVVDGQEAVNAASAIDGYGDLVGVLRVLVPGTEPAEVTVTALPEDGSAPAPSSVFEVQGGIVTDFPLGGFADGTWTIKVSSDRPAVAAVRTSTVTLADAPAAPATPGAPVVAPEPEAVVATDFAWFVGAPSLTADSLVSVAPGPSSVLHLLNDGSSEATVAIEATRGAGTTVTIPAGEALAVPVAADASYRVTGFQAARLSVTYSGEGALASFVVSPPDRGSQAVTVFHRGGFGQGR